MAQIAWFGFNFTQRKSSNSKRPTLFDDRMINMQLQFETQLREITAETYKNSKRMLYLITLKIKKKFSKTHLRFTWVFIAWAGFWVFIIVIY